MVLGIRRRARASRMPIRCHGDWRDGAGPLWPDWQPLLAALLDDLKRGVDGGIMAARFHNAAVAGMVAVA